MAAQRATRQRVSPALCGTGKNRPRSPSYCVTQFLDQDMTSQTFRFGPRLEDGRTDFRFWAPSASQVDLLIDGSASLPMRKDDDGFHSITTDAGPGTRYKFRIGELYVPDLASRQQAGDSRDWSVVRAPLTPIQGLGRPWHETVIAEVHVGTATPEGTFTALAQKLEHFRDAGFTCLEIMPVNQFPGTRNWGYDGTLIFAPASAYGTPEELRDLVARAHELGLSMILDVVYNHFGSVDNFVADYAPEWFDSSVETPWGPGIDFTKQWVRKFYYENAVMWLAEYGFDGLRFDAIHEIKSEAKDRFLGELAKACRIARPDARLIVENMNNSTRWLERDDQNRPMTYWAQWNEDIHHVLAFIVTGEGNKTGYDEPGKDPVADLEKALADGFVHDRAEGPDSDGRTRGGPASRLPPDSFITYVENHDQIGNRADGQRLSSRIEPRQLDFLHFVKFIAPQIPLCFMGDEANFNAPFPFFVDLDAEEGEKANQRRNKEMREMFKEEVEDGDLPHPNDPATFDSAKLPWAAYDEAGHRAALDRFRQLAVYRRDMVWPLASTPCVDARSARHDQGIVVTWAFEAGSLSPRA
ncbi:MAG: malto-oligosyltrehalose trehalohydrolase [Hyphomicrobiales bacterium]|nr:MAG: malto-oligosyltrehalose trehalohydrolase [Hyphomicrobiales bacterium]